MYRDMTDSRRSAGESRFPRGTLRVSSRNLSDTACRLLSSFSQVVFSTISCSFEVANCRGFRPDLSTTERSLPYCSRAWTTGSLLIQMAVKTEHFISSTGRSWVDQPTTKRGFVLTQMERRVTRHVLDARVGSIPQKQVDQRSSVTNGRGEMQSRSTAAVRCICTDARLQQLLASVEVVGSCRLAKRILI